MDLRYYPSAAGIPLTAQRPQQPMQNMQQLQQPQRPAAQQMQMQMPSVNQSQQQQASRPMMMTSQAPATSAQQSKKRPTRTERSQAAVLQQNQLMNPPKPQQPTPQSQAQAQLLQKQALAMKRKTLDRVLDKVTAVIPESRLYTTLQEFEKRIDSSIQKKLADMAESIKRPPRVNKTLRLSIYNEYSNQDVPIDGPSPYIDLTGRPRDPPTWTLKLVGCVLDSAPGDPSLQGDPSHQSSSSSSSSSKPGTRSSARFSHLISKVVVELDKTLYPDAHTIQWISQPNKPEADGFEIKRRGNKDFTATISLYIAFMPARFKLSVVLANLLKLHTESRQRITYELWNYIKDNKLQDNNDRTTINCNDALKAIFGADRLKFPVLAQRLTEQLLPPDPVRIQYKVRVSGEATQEDYDVKVDIEDPVNGEIAQFINKPLGFAQEANTLDEQIYRTIEQIQSHKKKRDFMMAFFNDPVNFIHDLIISQSNDLRIIQGDTSRNPDEERRSRYYHQPWVDECAKLYLKEVQFSKHNKGESSV